MKLHLINLFRFLSSVVVLHFCSSNGKKLSNYLLPAISNKLNYVRHSSQIVKTSKELQKRTYRFEKKNRVQRTLWRNIMTMNVIVRSQNRSWDLTLIFMKICEFRLIFHNNLWICFDYNAKILEKFLIARNISAQLHHF